MRASDQERERLVLEVREHFAAGRLSDEELDQRVQAAYAARTTGELAQLRADLPKLPLSPVQQRAELQRRRAHLQRRLIQEAGGSLGAFMICTVIWIASGAQGSFWPVWVAIAPAIILGRGAWRLYGPAPELDQLEQELDRDQGLRRELRREARASARRGRQLKP